MRKSKFMESQIVGILGEGYCTSYLTLPTKKTWIKMKKITKLGFSLLFMYKIFMRKKNIMKLKNECIVMGNGPSLECNIDEIINKKNNADVVCVNKFAFSKYYKIIKPMHYYICDHMYFEEIDNDESALLKFGSKKVEKVENDYVKQQRLEFIESRDRLVNEIIETTNWPIIMHFPLHYINSNFVKKFKYKKNIEIRYQSHISFDTRFELLRNIMYSTKIFAPILQNVLIASIIGMVRFGYKKITIYGADHSWHEELVLDQKNTRRFQVSSATVE
jgi:hypothetical protein